MYVYKYICVCIYICIYIYICTYKTPRACNEACSIDFYTCTRRRVYRSCMVHHMHKTMCCIGITKLIGYGTERHAAEWTTGDVLLMIRP